VSKQQQIGYLIQKPSNWMSAWYRYSLSNP